MIMKYLPKLNKEFSFAGFTWPRYVARLSIGQKAIREKHKSLCGEYYHAPKPDRYDGFSGYLSSDGTRLSGMRVREASEYRSYGRSSSPKFYCDSHQSEMMYGIVILLPHSRYLAGWTMGEGMSTCVEAKLYDDLEEAAYDAHRLAESAAEREREYMEEEQKLEDEDEADLISQETVTLKLPEWQTIAAFIRGSMESNGYDQEVLAILDRLGS
jgi:hypothetical protein